MTNIEQLEAQLSNDKQLIELSEKIVKLSKNKDFDKIIIQGFVETESSRLVGAAGDPTISTKDKEAFLNMAQAGGHLKRYLSTISKLGNTARDNVVHIEQELAELRASGE